MLGARRVPNEDELRGMFIASSQMVLDRRAQLDIDLDAAQTDAQRHHIARVFPRELAQMYNRIDMILDAYLELKR